jgi:hypothetical protein
MDFRSKVILLCSILGGLILMLFLGSFFSAESIRAREAATPLVAGLNPVLADKVDITVKGKSVELRKTDMGWNLVRGDKPIQADPDKVTGFLQNIADLKRFAVISTNPDTFPKFALDEAAASRVRVFDASGKSMVDLYLGKSDAASSQYVRLAGVNQVVQTDTQLAVSTDTRDWVDLKLFSKVPANAPINTIQIKNISFFPDLGKPKDNKHPAKEQNIPYDYTIVVKKTEDSMYWTVKGRGDMVLSNSKVESLINNFLDFSAEELVANSAESAERLQHPGAVVVMTTDDGLRYSLIIGAGPPNKQFRYYVKSSEKKYVYQASEWIIMQIIKKPEELAAKNPQ